MQQEMRRQDRKVTDATVVQSVLDQAEVVHIGLYDKGQVYVVPLNYGWSEKEGKYTLYCHSAHEGRKIDLIGNGVCVGFSMECGVKVVGAPAACDFSTCYKSIIGDGQASLVQTLEDKRAGMQAIMAHYSHQEHWDFPDPLLKQIQVIRIKVENLSCKVHR